MRVMRVWRGKREDAADEWELQVEDGDDAVFRVALVGTELHSCWQRIAAGSWVLAVVGDGGPAREAADCAVAHVAGRYRLGLDY